MSHKTSVQPYDPTKDYLPEWYISTNQFNPGNWKRVLDILATSNLKDKTKPKEEDRKFLSEFSMRIGSMIENEGNVLFMRQQLEQHCRERTIALQSNQPVQQGLPQGYVAIDVDKCTRNLTQVSKVIAIIKEHYPKLNIFKQPYSQSVSFLKSYLEKLDFDKHKEYILHHQWLEEWCRGRQESSQLPLERPIPSASGMQGRTFSTSMKNPPAAAASDFSTPQDLKLHKSYGDKTRQLSKAWRKELSSKSKECLIPGNLMTVPHQNRQQSGNYQQSNMASGGPSGASMPAQPVSTTSSSSSYVVKVHYQSTGDKSNRKNVDPQITNTYGGQSKSEKPFSDVEKTPVSPVVKNLPNDSQNKNNTDGSRNENNQQPAPLAIQKLSKTTGSADNSGSTGNRIFDDSETGQPTGASHDQHSNRASGGSGVARPKVAAAITGAIGDQSQAQQSVEEKTDLSSLNKPQTKADRTRIIEDSTTHTHMYGDGQSAVPPSNSGVSEMSGQGVSRPPKGSQAGYPSPQESGDQQEYKQQDEKRDERDGMGKADQGGMDWQSVDDEMLGQSNLNKPGYQESAPSQSFLDKFFGSSNQPQQGNDKSGQSSQRNNDLQYTVRMLEKKLKEADSKIKTLTKENNELSEEKKKYKEFKRDVCGVMDLKALESKSDEKAFEAIAGRFKTLQECYSKALNDIQWLHTQKQTLEEEKVKWESCALSLDSKCRSLENDKDQMLERIKSNEEMLTYLKNQEGRLKKSVQETTDLLIQERDRRMKSEKEKNELTDKFSRAMHDKISMDESSTENINAKNRPSLIADAYRILITDHWMDVMEAVKPGESEMLESLDFVDKEKQAMHAVSELMMLCYKTAKEALDMYKTDRRNLLQQPVVSMFSSRRRAEAENEPGEPSGVGARSKKHQRPTPTPAPRAPKSQDASKEKSDAEIFGNQLTALLLNYLKASSDSVEITPMVQDVMSRVCKDQEIFSVIGQKMGGEDISLFIEKCCRLCWKMVIQQPPMSLNVDGCGQPLVKEKQELYYECRPSKDAIVSFYVKPALYHDTKLMQNGMVYTEAQAKSRGKKA